jgi:hypothetical protein
MTKLLRQGFLANMILERAHGKALVGSLQAWPVLGARSARLATPAVRQ